MNELIIKINEKLEFRELDREGYNDFISLTELWKKHAPLDKNGNPNKDYRPFKWLDQHTTKRHISSIIRMLQNRVPKALFITLGCRGTYAHISLALAYLQYLNPDLHVIANEYFLRIGRNDITLANEIYQKANREDQEWLEKRIDSKVKRLKFTDTLQEHGVIQPVQYAICTNSIYESTMGKSAAELKKEKGLAKRDSLRDSFSEDELKRVTAAESLADLAITVKELQGFKPCNVVCQKVGAHVQAFLDSI